MLIDAAFLLALGGLVTAVIALIPALGAYRQSKTKARQDEVELLRGEVKRLSERVGELSASNARLQSESFERDRKILALELENTWLRGQLRTHGIEIPPLPAEIRRLQNPPDAESSVGNGDPGTQLDNSSRSP